jgi:hypothetical protein
MAWFSDRVTSILVRENELSLSLDILLFFYFISSFLVFDAIVRNVTLTRNSIFSMLLLSHKNPSRMAWDEMGKHPLNGNLL